MPWRWPGQPSQTCSQLVSWHCKSGSDFTKRKCPEINELSDVEASCVGLLDSREIWIVLWDNALDSKLSLSGKRGGIRAEPHSAVHCFIRDVLVATKTPCVFLHQLHLLHCHTSCSLAWSRFLSLSHSVCQTYDSIRWISCWQR